MTCLLDFNAVAPLTCLKDQPRKGEKLTLSPSGTLAAITDSLGRILLLDTQALVVVRLWKVCWFLAWLLFSISPIKNNVLGFLLASNSLFKLWYYCRDIEMPAAYSWRCWLIKILHHQAPHIMNQWRVITACVWLFMRLGKELSRYIFTLTRAKINTITHALRTGNSSI